MDNKQHGQGVSNIQSMYINRVRNGKERVDIACRDNTIYHGTILAFDMYTVLVNAEMQEQGHSVYRQMLLYKNNIISIRPAGNYVPIDMVRYNKGE